MNVNFKFLKEGIEIPEQFVTPLFFVDKRNETFLCEENNFVGNLRNIKNINFLVGANNSGKSRFLRGFFNTFNVKLEVFREIPVANLKNEIANHEILKKEHKDYPLYSNDILRFLKYVKNFGILITNFSAHDLLVDYLENPKTYNNFLDSCRKGKELLYENSLKTILLDFEGRVKELYEELEFWHLNYCSFKMYIPPLRSLLMCDQLEKNNLYDLAQKHLQVKKDSFQDLFTGLELYDKVVEVRNSIQSEELREFERFIGKNFFNDLRIELIPDLNKSKVLLVKIDNQEHRAINELGDGIQAIILLTYPIYTAKPKTWFFIEEPEINLHPGFQRIFIETLLNDPFLKDQKHKYFFTTHSNHFLDLSIKSDETAIFQFKKEKENYHTIKTGVKPDKDVLDELGVNTSSVFLANTSLWVEGPTDRKYLSKFLKLYCKYEDLPYLKEDIDFAFFEYAGSLISHYLFNDEILEEEKEVRDKINSFASANKIYLLADSDNASKTSKKGKRKKRLEIISNEKKNFKYQNTKVKEIENILPVKTLKSFLRTLTKNDEDLEKVKLINFKKTDYNKIGIGAFFEEKFKEVGITEFKSFKVQSKSGTLDSRYKTRLCQHFIDSEITYDELIEGDVTLNNLIKELYKFIVN